MQAYTQRRKTGAASERAETAAPGPSIQELAAGAQPTDAQMGHRVDLPDAIREKMESSFGADFSNVKLYESQTVADAGAEAMTQGSNIAFAPGQLDLASTAGQALLGHELSHVVSQARGESAGQGFLNDPGLEAQADMQGEMAARGESVYSGPVSPIGASSAMSAAGPMQAKKKKDKARSSFFEQVYQNDRSPSQWMEKGDKSMARTMMPAGKEHMDELMQSGYLDIASYKMNQTKNKDEQQDILNLFLSGEDSRIHKYLMDDFMGLSMDMQRDSRDMAQENFDTRADAYARSGSTNMHMKALERAGITDSLSEDELDIYNGVKNNFTNDRRATHDSMADAMGLEAVSKRMSREERKNYRRRRRNEIYDPDEDLI